MKSTLENNGNLPRTIMGCVLTSLIAVLAGRCSAQQSNTLTWVGPVAGSWSVPGYWDPNGPPDSTLSALIGPGTCTIDGNYQAQCLNLYLGGNLGAGTLNQSGGQLIVDGNVYAGYGNNSGVFSQTDGNTYIGRSLFVGFNSSGGSTSLFDFVKGSIVVSGDVWFGDPDQDTNEVQFGLGGSDANVKVGGSIHVARNAGGAFGGELSRPEANLCIFNDGTVNFGNDNNYNYLFDRIVSTDPNGPGYFTITHRCIVNVKQINQRYVEVDGGFHGVWWSCNLNVLGTPEAYESNIVDGMENYDGNFRVANARVNMGFLSTYGGDGGRCWVDETGILRVTYIRQESISVCSTGQLFVRGQASYDRGPRGDGIVTVPMIAGMIANDGNCHLADCSLEADRIHGVDGGVSGWTILDSNVVLTVNNNVQQGYVTIVDSAALLVSHFDGNDSRIAYGIENAGDLEIGGGTLYSPYVVGIDGDVAGRTWIDGDGNLVTGRIVQESVYIADGAVLTLTAGGAGYDPNFRTQVVSTGTVHVASGSHVLGFVGGPDPNASLGAIVIEANAELRVSGFRVDSVTIGPGASLTIDGNADGSGIACEVNRLTIASHVIPDDGNVVWEGTLDIKGNSLLIPDGNYGNRLVVHDGNYSDIVSMIKSGLYSGVNGYWDGPGINSSTAANDGSGLTAVGVLDSASAGFTETEWEGVTGLDGNEILVKYTYFGDADLDGNVTVDDYTLWGNGYLGHLTGWVNGDFDYSGDVTVDDYTLWGNSYLATGSRALELAEFLGMAEPRDLTDFLDILDFLTGYTTDDSD